ncbi:MAG: EamA family transporter [Bacteroidales bacterium]|nr:EamA family transporter [Bacteroidales bacterium]
MSYIWSDQLLRLDIPVFYIVCIRSLIAGLALMLINLLLGNNIRIKRKDLPKFLGMSLCEPFIYFVCETYGIKLTESPTYSALVIATAPIFSVAAGVAIFKEKVNWVNILGIVICIIGLGVVTHGSTAVGDHFVLGIFLLLIAVMSEVGYASCTKSLSRHYKPMVIVQYQFLIGGVMLLPLFATKGLASFDAGLYLSWAVWKPILCLALLCSSVAFTLWASTIKNLGVARASIFLAMIPVVTAFIGAILGTEILNAKQWTGIAIAFFGLVLTQYVIRWKRS